MQRHWLLSSGRRGGSAGEPKVSTIPSSARTLSPRRKSRECCQARLSTVGAHKGWRQESQGAFLGLVGGALHDHAVGCGGEGRYGCVRWPALTLIPVLEDQPGTLGMDMLSLFICCQQKVAS